MINVVRIILLETIQWIDKGLSEFVFLLPSFVFMSQRPISSKGKSNMIYITNDQNINLIFKSIVIFCPRKESLLLFHT